MDQLTPRPVTATLPAKVRGARPPNEIDFWRGYALTAIFINHVPGLWYEQFTHSKFGFSDSAELFVLLAGWSMRSLVDRQSKTWTSTRLVLRLGGRAVVLYIAQIVITVLALAIIAATALVTETTLVLQWNNAAAFFEEPLTAHLGMVFLTYQLGYFDILPLYIVLMCFAPLMAMLYRWSTSLLLFVSLAVYAATLTLAFNLPTWPVEGRWFFNPLAWQLIFVLGFILGGDGPIPSFVARWRGLFRALGFAIAVLGLIGTIYRWWPHPLNAPYPALFFVADKTFLTPMRLFHALGLAMLFGGAFFWILKYARPLARFFSMLGRNSLNVFCVGSLLSLSAQVVRFSVGGGWWVDTVVLFVGLLGLCITAWVSEWRARLST